MLNDCKCTMNPPSQSKSNGRAWRLIVISTLLVSAILLLLLSRTETWPRRAIFRHKMVTAPVQRPPGQALDSCLQGVVTTVPGGRLGNLALEYATAWAAARRYGLRLAVADTMHEQLSVAFDGLTAPPLSRLLREPQCSRYNLSEAQLLTNDSYQVVTPASLQEMVDRARSNHLPLVLKKYTLMPELVASSVKEIRQEFHFRPEIQLVADKKLAEAKGEVAKLARCNQSQVCTVGIHVRRSDYGEYMREVYHLQQEVDIRYYKAATIAMLQYLSTMCAAAAFVVTSDGNKWCQRRLLPALRSVTAERLPLSEVFLLSSEDPIADLCLLASCQHSILSYGTFGTLAAILAGGKVMLYDITQHGTRHRPPYFRLTDYLPNWSSLP